MEQEARALLAGARSKGFLARLTPDVIDEVLGARRWCASPPVERARAGDKLHEGAEVNVTQEAIAHSIGSVREVVTVALGELRGAHVIETRRASITIVDLRALLYEAHRSRLEE